MRSIHSHSGQRETSHQSLVNSGYLESSARATCFSLYLPWSLEVLAPRLSIEAFHNTRRQAEGLEKPSVDPGAKEDLKRPSLQWIPSIRVVQEGSKEVSLGQTCGPLKQRIPIVKCCFGSMSFLVSVHVVICSDLGLEDSFEKPGAPIQKPCCSPQCPWGTVFSSSHYPLAPQIYITGGGRESFVCFVMCE